METPPAVEAKSSIFRETHLRDYWKIVWQGRWTALAVFLVIVGATAVWSFVQTPIYRATATIEIQPQARQLTTGQDVSGLGAAGYGWFAEEKYHNTQVEILKSRDISTRVFDALDLHSHPRLSKYSDPIDIFRGMIQVVPRRETGLIEVSISGAEADEVTEWVNAVIQAYVDRNFEKARANMDSAVTAVEQQLAGLKQSFETAQSERYQKLDDLQVGSEHKEEIVQERLKSFESELTVVQLDLSRLSDTLQRIRGMQGRSADLMSMPALSEDPTLKELDRTKVRLEGELERARVELRPGHPDYEEIASELSKVEQRIQDRVGVVLGTLQNKFNAARDREGFLHSQIAAAEDLSRKVARDSTEYELIKTDAETKRGILDIIARTMQEVQLGAQLLNNNVSVLDQASIPLYPIKPRKKLNLVIGAILGAFLGLAAAFFLDYLDNTFRTPEDIEKYLNLAVLAVIPKSEDRGISDRAVREAYQSLRTSIIFSSEARQRKLILITSTGPQEGKSSTVANLGRTLAAAGDRVIIIDCDLRRPTQHVHHGVERDHGVTNFLSSPLDRTDWTVYAKTAGPANLHLLSCGPVPPNPPELLGGTRFAGLLDSLKERYDWVLVDSPPAASLADTSLLAALTDMVVLVVQHYQTDRDLVSKTLQRLRAVNSHVVGAVLNNVDLDRAYHKDYYYAGYYYADDGTEKKKKKRDPSAASVG